MTFDHYVIKDEEVIIPRDTNAKIDDICHTFVRGMDDSCRYHSENRNVNYSKAQEDQFISKKCEFATQAWMHRRFGYPLINIDVAIRKSVKKGWLCDLPYKNTNPTLKDVHVKSCSAKTLSLCKDYSWTFQLKNTKGTGGRDPLLDAPYDEYVALTYIETPKSNSVIIKAFCPWGVLKPLLKDPIVEKYKDLKRCLYYKDIKSMETLVATVCR